MDWQRTDNIAFEYFNINDNEKICGFKVKQFLGKIRILSAYVIKEGRYTIFLSKSWINEKTIIKSRNQRDIKQANNGENSQSQCIAILKHQTN